MNSNYPWGLSPEVADILKEFPPSDFHPLAYYDKHLDCIRVLIKDCSTTEIRLDRIFTIYGANHTGSLEYVGFSIKGVRYFVEKLGLHPESTIVIAEIINQIVKENPEACVDIIQRMFGKILNEITIDDIEFALVA